MKIALTGASGFVGRHLIQYLAERHHEVVAVSQTQTSVSGQPAFRVDSYLDDKALARAFDGIDVVVHLAARAHVLAEAASSPLDESNRANRDTAQAVAAAAAAAGVRRVILVSSIGVHGNRTHGRPFSESDPPAPVEDYAVSKWAGEKAAANILAGTRTELVVLRPPLVYGPGCPGNFRTLMSLVRRLPLVPLGGFSRPRSLIHVGNLSDAIRTAAIHPGIGGKTFVLSDGDDLSVADVARHLAVGYGKASWQTVAVPESLCRLLARMVGREQTLDKLAAELLVDSSAFRSATGWLAPYRASAALQDTAAQDARLRAAPGPTPR